MSNSSNRPVSSDFDAPSTKNAAMSEFIPTPSPGAALKIAAALLNGPTEYVSLLLTQLAPTNAAPHRLDDALLEPDG